MASGSPAVGDAEKRQGGGMVLVDLEDVRTQVCRVLPQKVRWMVGGNHLDFDFSRAQNPLTTIQPSDLIENIEDQWLRLFLLGQRYYEGGASPFLGVDSTSKEIYGLDVEREAAVFFLNSGVREFIQMFLLFDEAVRLCQKPFHLLPSLASVIDPQSFTKSEWRDLAQYLIKQESPPSSTR
jgi:hypothetical protein